MCFSQNSLQPLPRLQCCKRPSKLSTQCECTITPIGWLFFVQPIAAECLRGRGGKLSRMFEKKQYLMNTLYLGLYFPVQWSRFSALRLCLLPSELLLGNQIKCKKQIILEATQKMVGFGGTYYKWLCVQHFFVGLKDKISIFKLFNYFQLYQGILSIFFLVHTTINYHFFWWCLHIDFIVFKY